MPPPPPPSTSPMVLPSFDDDRSFDDERSDDIDDIDDDDSDDDDANDDDDSEDDGAARPLTEAMRLPARWSSWRLGSGGSPSSRRQAVAVEAEHRQLLQPTERSERAVAQSVVAKVELAERAELSEPRDRRQPVPLELEVLELREDRGTRPYARGRRRSRGAR